jgi:hypothetical protein
VSVTLSADDDPTGSGVYVIRYTIDGTDPTPVNGSDYVGAFDIFTTTTVKFRSYDNLGNEEPVGSQLIRVDGTPPTLSLSLAEQPASGAQHIGAPRAREELELASGDSGLLGPENAQRSGYGRSDRGIAIQSTLERKF